MPPLATPLLAPLSASSTGTKIDAVGTENCSFLPEIFITLAGGYKSQELRAAVTERLPSGKPRFSTFMDHPVREDFSEATIESSETMVAFREVRLPLVGGLVDRLDRPLLHALLGNPIYAQLFSFVECGGLFAGRTFLTWLQEKLAQKGVGATDTLSAFHEKTGADLSVVASDTTDKEMLILNHRTAPACPVVWAVRMSMSIPFIWQAVVWQEDWGPYLARPKAGNVIVDGGVLSNFPIRLIAEQNDHTRPLMGETDPDAARNLGLLIDETLLVPGASASAKPPKPASRLRTVQRATQLIDTMTGAADNEAIRQHQAEIYRIPAKGYGTTEFDMATDRLEALIDGGRLAMTRYFESLRL